MKQTTAKAQAKTISKTTGRVKGTWGGRRPGAGRKPMCDKAMTETATVRLSVEQVTSFRALGGAIWFRDVLNQAMAADPKLASGVSKPDGLIPVKVKTHVKVPSGYSAVQAGFPSPAEQYQGESIDFNDLLITNAASTFVLKAKGESMIEAGIDEGDLLVVDRSVTELSLFAVGAVCIIFLFVLLSNTYFLRSIVNPIREINDTTKRIAAGEYGITIEKKFNDEIGELADSINFMSSETQRSIMIKNDFISSVSHELRTPLTAINGWAETLLHSEGLDKIEQRGLSVILRESNHLREMVEELLDFSRIESGRLVINKTTMDVKAELEDTILMFEQRLQQDKLHVVYTDCCGSEVLIQGDRSRLRQVFVNIIDNARKYSPPNETIDIKIERRSEWAAVVIADHGSGIPAADLPRVKQKFYKGNANKPGSGIGLAVSDEIVQMHGGELRIESEEGNGTVVTILLPLDRR